MDKAGKITLVEEFEIDRLGREQIKRSVDMEQISEFYLSDVNSAVEERRDAEKDINLTECLNRHANSMSQMYDSLQKVLSFISDIALPCVENMAREEIRHIPEEDLLKLHAQLCEPELKGLN